MFARAMSERMLTNPKSDASSANVEKYTLQQSDAKDVRDCALKISFNAALRERGDEARPRIMSELQQMINKKV